MFPAQRGVSALYGRAFTHRRQVAMLQTALGCPACGCAPGGEASAEVMRGEPAEHEWSVEGKGEIRAGCHVEKGERGQQTPRAAMIEERRREIAGRRYRGRWW